MAGSGKKKTPSRKKNKGASIDKPPSKPRKEPSLGEELTLSELAQRLIEEVQRIKNSNEHVANRIDAIEDEIDAMILQMRGIVDTLEVEDNVEIRRKVAERLYQRIGDTLETNYESEVFRKISGIENDIEKHLREIRNLIEHFRRKERDLVSVLIINRFTKTVDSAFTLPRQNP
ncbi:MAG: hypothetical protein ACYS8W_18550 [Planctomycetota bacterium]|jgi:hypothetical protein